jgi:AAA+ superfamily predicted ATPase
MRRVLNSFLQFLEEPHNTDSVILCATNHPELLDRALFRRFGDVLEYSLPDHEVAKELLRSRLSSFGFEDSWWPTVCKYTEGLSHAELVAASEDVMKQVILSDGQHADAVMLQDKLQKKTATRDVLANLEK